MYTVRLAVNFFFFHFKYPNYNNMDMLQSFNNVFQVTWTNEQQIAQQQQQWWPIANIYTGQAHVPGIYFPKNWKNVEFLSIRWQKIVHATVLNGHKNHMCYNKKKTVWRASIVKEGCHIVQKKVNYI